MSTITKLAHSSFLIEHKDTLIVFDPGSFTEQNERLHNIDLLLITHGHDDHFTIENVQYIQAHSPNLTIVTNSEVSATLEAGGINATVLEGSDATSVHGVTVTAQDEPHEEIYGTFGQVQNTGYYIDDLFFHPGDAFAKPAHPTKAIATVVAAPFMSIKDAISYMNATSEADHIATHDAVVTTEVFGWLEGMVEANLDEGITYRHVAAGESVEY